MDGEEVTVVEEKELTLVEANGNRVYFTLGLYAALYSSAAVLAVLRRWISAAIFSLLAIAFTVMGLLTVGGMYVPSALAILLGWLVLGIWGVVEKIRGRRRAVPR